MHHCLKVSIPALIGGTIVMSRIRDIDIDDSLGLALVIMDCYYNRDCIKSIFFTTVVIVDWWETSVKPQMLYGTPES
jgi:hypothetical protein